VSWLCANTPRGQRNCRTEDLNATFTVDELKKPAILQSFLGRIVDKRSATECGGCAFRIGSAKTRRSFCQTLHSTTAFLAKRQMEADFESVGPRGVSRVMNTQTNPDPVIIRDDGSNLRFQAKTKFLRVVCDMPSQL
jgi:hypothetical protein